MGRAVGPELAGELHAAQQELAGDRLRELSAQRRQLIAELMPEVSRIAAAAGVAASTGALDEVRATLEAALADAGARDAVRTGQLTRALSYAGIGEVDPAAALAVGPGARHGGGGAGRRSKAAGGRGAAGDQRRGGGGAAKAPPGQRREPTGAEARQGAAMGAASGAAGRGAAGSGAAGGGPAGVASAEKGARRRRARRDLADAQEAARWPPPAHHVWKAARRAQVADRIGAAASSSAAGWSSFARTSGRGRAPRKPALARKLRLGRTARPGRGGQGGRPGPARPCSLLPGRTDEEVLTAPVCRLHRLRPVLSGRRCGLLAAAEPTA